MEELVRALTIGLTNGLIIALIAIGYTLVYGILELINFAHADVFMLGTAFTYFATDMIVEVARHPGLIAFGLGGDLHLPADRDALHGRHQCRHRASGLPAAAERAPTRPPDQRDRDLVRPPEHRPGHPRPIADCGSRTCSRRRRLVNLPSGAAWFGVDELVVVLVTLPLLLGLRWFVGSTRQGKAMRATAQDRDASGLMGIDVNRTISLTFLIAGALAGAAGLIVALYYRQTFFQYGFQFGLLSFTAAVIGGIGNLTGATLGALVLGVIAALSDRFLEAKWTTVYRVRDPHPRPGLPADRPPGREAVGARVT